MNTIALSAQKREAGKKNARAIRRMGDVPCVLYGQEVDPVLFQITEKSLNSLIYTNEMHIVQVALENDSWECILKDIAFHPVTDRPMHVDFQVLSAGKKVTITVPVRYIGTPRGQIAGGKSVYSVTELTVTCLPKDIPSHIAVDVTDVRIGKAIHVRDLDREGLTFLAPPGQILMVVERPKRSEVDETSEGEEDS